MKRVMKGKAWMASLAAAFCVLLVLSGAAAAEAQPVSDLRGPVEYKRDVVRVLTTRALRRAVARAKGGK